MHAVTSIREDAPCAGCTKAVWGSGFVNRERDDRFTVTAGDQEFGLRTGVNAQVSENVV